jgi:hypothetical protein
MAQFSDSFPRVDFDKEFPAARTMQPRFDSIIKNSDLPQVINSMGSEASPEIQSCELKPTSIFCGTNKENVSVAHAVEKKG